MDVAEHPTVYSFCDANFCVSLGIYGLVTPIRALQKSDANKGVRRIASREQRGRVVKFNFEI